MKEEIFSEFVNGYLRMLVTGADGNLKTSEVHVNTAGIRCTPGEELMMHLQPSGGVTSVFRTIVFDQGSALQPLMVDIGDDGIIRIPKLKMRFPDQVVSVIAMPLRLRRDSDPPFLSQSADGFRIDTEGNAGVSTQVYVTKTDLPVQMFTFYLKPERN